MHLNIYTDGASRGNPGHAAVGIIVKDDNFRILAEVSRYIGITTNNVAEYQAVLIALETVHSFGAISVTLFTDSELVCRQLMAKYRVKSKNILPLYNKVISMTAHFESFSVIYIKREQNAEADRLANIALDNELKKQKSFD
jgi:ribonuclease HI